jgi:ElaB/YqjD/DUF883 family membrane-anchored ribosome-binding protein
MARKPSNPLIDEQIMDQAFSELAALVEESEGLLNEGRGRRYSRKLRRQLDQVLQRATDLANQIAEQAAPAVHSTEGYVRQHPGKALALAATAGALVAMLVNRR